MNAQQNFEIGDRMVQNEVTRKEKLLPKRKTWSARLSREDWQLVLDSLSPDKEVSPLQRGMLYGKIRKQVGL